jgi:hypothetical protein
MHRGPDIVEHLAELPPDRKWKLVAEEEEAVARNTVISICLCIFQVSYEKIPHDFIGSITISCAMFSFARLIVWREFRLLDFIVGAIIMKQVH